MCYWLAEPL